MKLNHAIMALTVTAIMLTGLVLLRHSDTSETQQASVTDILSMASVANAGEGFIVTDGTTTVLTAPWDQSEDFIYVLDNASGQLMIYRVDTGRNPAVVRIVDTLDVAQAMKIARERLGAGGGVN